jgi:integrase/recombinase XerC
MAAPEGELPEPWRAVVDSFRDYLIVAGRGVRTVELRLYHLGRFARMNTAGPSTVRPEAVLKYVARADWAPATRRVVRDTLAAFFGWALDSGLVTSDPTVSLPVAKAPAWTPRPASRKEINAAIKGAADPRVKLMIRLGADAGLSAAEIAAVRPRDVQENDGDYFIRTIGKANHVRVVPLPPSLAEEISRSTDEYLFPSRENDGHFTSAYISRLVSRAFPREITSENVRQAFTSSGGGHRVPSWRDATFHPSDDAGIIGGADVADNRAIQTSFRRIARFMETDPATAISESKNVLETLFKLILEDRGQLPTCYVPLAPMFDLVVSALGLKSDAVPGNPDASEEVSRILSGLVTTVSGINKTRNELGTGHGQHDATDPDSRHARLVFNATVAVGEFLTATLADRQRSES